MPSRLGLYRNTIFSRALDRAGHIFGIVWSDDSVRNDGDVEIIRLYPRNLVKGIGWEGDAIPPTVADGSEAVL